MALFGTKNKEVKSKEGKVPAVVTDKNKTASPVAGVSLGAANTNLNRVILRPRITEKATMKADAENVFVFEIAQNANKTTVRQAVAKIFNVVPLKVSIVRNPSKKVFLRGKRGVVSGVKKAYVYLKKGDKIEIV